MRYLFASSISEVSEYRRPALLLLHGLLGYSFSWRLNLPVLARWFRVYAPDAMGAGFSDRPYDLDCSVAATAIRCLQFMDSVGLESAHVIGSSYGGAVAASMAEQAPERVRCLVLAAPVNPWSSHGLGLIHVLSFQGGAFLLAHLAPLLQPLHGLILRRMYGDALRIPPGTLQGYTAPLRIPGTLRHLLAIVKIWQKDMEALQETYRCLGDRPVLLLWGARDGAVLPQSAGELQRRILNSELRVLPTVGHLPYEEAPQEFNRIVVEFLREHSSLE
jgi:pimeloyl-ACP methyl ester carboxylesterase